MTRPETLVASLARAALATLEAERQAINRRTYPAVKVPPRLQALYREYKRVERQRDQLLRQLQKAGVDTYGPCRMRDRTSELKKVALTAVINKVAAVQNFKDAAMLEVLGLTAEKARPAVLKLKRRLQVVVRAPRQAR